MTAYSPISDDQPRKLIARPADHYRRLLVRRHQFWLNEGHMAEHTTDLRKDRPTASELLEIMAATLTETVVPATASHAQHQARVAANLCRILSRELATEAQPSVSLPETLLDADDATADAAYPTVLELVRSKLEINKPGYDSHGAAQERDIVA